MSGYDASSQNKIFDEHNASLTNRLDEHGPGSNESFSNSRGGEIETPAFQGLPDQNCSHGEVCQLGSEMASAVDNQKLPDIPAGKSPKRPSFVSPPPSKRLKLEQKPLDPEKLKKSIVCYKRSKLDLVQDRYYTHVAEMYFLQKDGNVMDFQAWLAKPGREYIDYIRTKKLIGDTKFDFYVSKLENPPMERSENHSGFSSPGRGGWGVGAKGHGSRGGRGDRAALKGQKGMQPGEGVQGGHQDQMVEKAKQEAYIIQRISVLRKDGLWGEKRLPKVQEPSRIKAHWDYLLEEMVWLSADFAQERKWKKAAAKKCARMVQKYFQDKALQVQRAEKEKEMRLRKIAAFVAKEVRVFWSNVEKLVEFKVNARLDEKKKKALDQQLSFIVDQTEKYSSMLAESMKRSDATAASNTSAPSVESPSDVEFEPELSSSDDENTIAKEEDNPEEQATELQLLQKESEQTFEDFLSELPVGYLSDREREHSIGIESEETSELSDTQCLSSVDSAVADATEAPSDVVGSEVSKERTRRERSCGRKRKFSCDDKNDVQDDEDDKDFKADASEDDDEATIEEQEKAEGCMDHAKELLELQEDNDIPVEELKKRYVEMADKMESEPAQDSIADEEQETEDSREISDMINASDEESETKGFKSYSGSSADEDSDDESSSTEDVFGIESLVKHSPVKKEAITDLEREDADKELQDASAVAESLQPKGFTLSSTEVTTPVPFLLRHTLREYQHVGLDWLVTMYEKKLNGILADEMGLGKTIQTIALLSHLACEKGIWGPHLIVVPTSVMLNWEMEFKKWCPAFKILTYYGSQKERKLKRQGWTKPNAFHVCITSYKLVIQDHQSFRRKKWKYFILDEAQNIKNFKSQRWQLLLNFHSQRRLLLTGTPLQNNLMELWSLMHFLMPNIFTSHREFKEWFSNPVTGMIEGNKEYNDNIIKRLHKVLRPFILRRLKSEVEQQMPKKYEHVIMCRLSKRQRFLYEEFMSRTKTKETLASGNFLSVINVLMQLRKVCNHPNLFESRPVISPFMMEGITYLAPTCTVNILDYDPFKHVDLFSLNLLLSQLERCLTAFAAHRIRRFQAPRKLIQEIDNMPEPPPKCPAGKIRLHVRPSSQPIPRPVLSSGSIPRASAPLLTLKPVTTTAPVSHSSVSLPTVTSATTTTPTFQSGVRFQLVQHGGSYKAIPLPAGSTGGMVVQQTPQGPRLVVPQRTVSAVQPATSTSLNASMSLPSVSSSSPISNTTSLGCGGTLGGLQLVQTSAGQYLLTSAPVQKPTSSPASIGVTGTSAAVALLQRLQSIKGLQGSVITTGAGGKPVLRLPTSSLRPTSQHGVVNPSNSNAKFMNTLQQQVQTTPAPSLLKTSQVPADQTLVQNSISATGKPLVSNLKPCESEAVKKEEPVRSVFYMAELEEARKEKRREKLDFMANLNIRRCHACPIYGSDLMEAVSVTLGGLKSADLSVGVWKGQGLVHCMNARCQALFEYLNRTEALHSMVKHPSDILDDLKDIVDRFLFCVPSVIAPPQTVRVFHMPPSRIWQHRYRDMVFHRELSPLTSMLHPIISHARTQFPDVRLIQYDCGKLQILDKLLRQLKSHGHRVLIFTQMTRMLDVFESFLNHHGHLYLRLDGTTRVDQRQVLMERFNQDQRIFAFILSTRSGGLGVNLTGADTVVFFDSDWNPTMDAQAQDRCHRIGQTRDVHIYRLISEKTVEENILKKANQKKLLGDLAIEGGNFTTACLKAQTIRDIFDVDTLEQDASKRLSEVLESKNEESEMLEGEKMKIGALESALAAAEDETDVQATKSAKAEADAELDEFDENIPIEECPDEEVSKAEQEVALLMKQLTPIEKYAMGFLESSDDGIVAEAERLAAEIEQQKREWELERIRALREEESRRAQQSDDELIFYSSVDANNQVNRRRFSFKRKKLSKASRTQDNSGGVYSSKGQVLDGLCDSSSTEGVSGVSDSEEGSNDDSPLDRNTDGPSCNGNSRKFIAGKASVRGKASGKFKYKESPRTRSRGQVSINLWTLDENPLIPGSRSFIRKQGLVRDRVSGDTPSIPVQLDSSDLAETKTVNICSSANGQEGVVNEMEGAEAMVLSNCGSVSVNHEPNQTDGCTDMGHSKSCNSVSVFSSSSPPPCISVLNGDSL